MRVGDRPLWWFAFAGVLWSFALFLQILVHSGEIQIERSAGDVLTPAQLERMHQTERLVDQLGLIVSLFVWTGGGIVLVQSGRLLLRRRSSRAGTGSLPVRVFQDSPCAMVVTDMDDIVRDVNPAYEKLTGYRRMDVVGMPLSFNHSGAEDEDTIRRMRERLVSSGAWEGQFWLRNRSGEAFSDKVLRRTFMDPDSGERGILTVSLDSTGSEEEKRLMLWQAHHDTLTKLPNRNLFQERFTRVVMNLKPDEHGAVLAIDLDNFKIINDSQGAAKGDQLLTQVAFRIALAASESDTVARLAGDHFAVLVESINDYSEAERLARNILEQIRMPFQLDDTEVTMTASIGICVFPTDGSDCGELMQRADAATAKVKARGGNGVQFFESAMNREAQRRLEIETALRKAIRDDQLLLHFQPVIDLRDGSVVGAEALVRWQHPEQGLISPGVFIPVAEESGLIIDLGAWVLRRVGRYLRECAEPAIENMRISVNVSAQQLRDDSTRQNFLQLLRRETASRLTLEITESALVADREGVHQFLGTAHELGYRTALDDFGTGFSSLSYLRDFRFDVLKVDKSFIDNLQDARHTGLVASIVSMGRILGMQIVAEGVEDESQVRKLRQVGCDYAQGYFYARPMPWDDFLRFVAPGQLRAVS